MIAGYAASASIAPGEKLVLHVSTDAPRFRVAMYQWVGRLEHFHTTAWLEGRLAPDGVPDADWGWPPYELPVPCARTGGVCIAHLEEPDGLPAHIAMGSAAVLFIVRSLARGGMLFKIPLATYNAYNFAGGGCLYAHPPPSGAPPGAKLSFHRPGVGIGGPVFGATDHYDASSPRQTFAHWDAPFIAWLYRQGYEPAFCTDLDLHRDAKFCEGHDLLLSVGHDEYWSAAMRDQVEAFITAGGNAAFFSANVCWWRIHLTDDATAMVCHQGSPTGAHDHWWPQHGAGRPEDSLSGLSYRHGGGWWDGPRQCGGYRVLDSAHWVFAGTGLHCGDEFGGNTSPPLIGYECDGAPLDAQSVRTGNPSLHRHAAACGTPAGLRLLAYSLLDANWQERAEREHFLEDSTPHAATMALHDRGGTVFAAGTTDWAKVLHSGDPVISRITRNVIDRLLSRQAHSEPT